MEYIRTCTRIRSILQRINWFKRKTFCSIMQSKCTFHLAYRCTGSSLLTRFTVSKPITRGLMVHCCMTIVYFRTIIFMRVFLLLGIMYLYRAATFSVTALPIADTNFKCYNKYNGSIPFEGIMPINICICTLICRFTQEIGKKNHTCKFKFHMPRLKVLPIHRAL